MNDIIFTTKEEACFFLKKSILVFLFIISFQPFLKVSAQEQGKILVKPKHEHKYILGHQFLPMKDQTTEPFSFTPSPETLISNCTNSDFSLGDWTNWTGCYGFFANPCQMPGFKTTPPHPVHKIIPGPGWLDHNTCDTLVNVFPGESFVARLGDTVYSTATHVDRKAGELKYQVNVTSDSYLFIYRYAVVLQTGNHYPPDHQPDFQIMITNAAGTVLDSTCGYYYITAQVSGVPVNGWHRCQNNSHGDIYWKDWTTVGMALTAYLGQTIYIQFKVRPCSYDTHFGYAYISTYCSQLEIQTSLCEGQDSAVLTAPPGFSYYWTAITGDHTIDGDTTASITVPSMEGASYQCKLTAVNGCWVDVINILHYTQIHTGFTATMNCAQRASHFFDTTWVSQNQVTAWRWFFGDPASGSSDSSHLMNPDHSFTAPGNYNVTLISYSTEGCSDTATKLVEVDTLVTINNSVHRSQICSNQHAIIILTTNVSNALFTWTATASSGTITGFSNNATPAPSPIDQILVNNGTQADSVTYIITPHKGTCTGDQFTYVVVVHPLPTATIAGTIALCQNSTAPLITLTGASATPPYTFTYNINGGLNQIITTTVGNSITVAAPTNTVGTFTYNLVSVQDASSTACSQTQTGSAAVTVNPLPTATINGTTAVCQNSTAPLIIFTGASATPPYTFTYNINSGSNQTVTTIVGNSVMIAVPTNTVGTFTYNLISVQDASSTACSQSQAGSAVVTVNPLPTATINGTTAVCQNSTAPLITFTGESTTPPYTFTYNINGGSNQTVTTIVGNSVTVAAPTNAGGIFTYNLVSVHDGSSTACSQPQSGSATITVNSLPVPSITGPGSVCLNSTATYSTEANMTNYIWTVSAGGTITSSPGTNSVNILWSTTGTKTITVNYHDANGCTAATPFPYTVTVNILPVPALDGLSVICAGDSTIYTTNAGMTNYSWTVSAGGVIIAGGGTSDNTATVLWNTAGAQTVSVNFVMGTGCTASSPRSMDVTVKPRPSVTNAANSTICSGVITNIPLLASLPLTTFTWTATGSSGNVQGQSNSGGPVISQTLVNLGVNIETVDYAVTPSLNGCDGPVAHYIVTVDPVADAYFNPNGQTLCSGGTSGISILSHVAGATFTWTAVGSSGNIGGFGPGVTSSIAQTLTNIGTGPGFVTYTISPSFNNCPGTSNSVVVTVNPLPSVTYTICNDMITTTAAQPFRLKGGLPLGGTYSGTGVNTGIFYPSIAGMGNHTITYSYPNTWGCAANATQVISVINPAVFLCDNSMTDIRDNQPYLTVKIGTQCWMAENLNYGNLIAHTQMQRDNCISEKYCFNDIPANCTSYGGLYQWDELMQYDNAAAAQGFCPPGWHVPTENEWNTLFNSYISNGFAGAPLKYTGYSGFNAFLSGTRFNNVNWNFSNFAVMFWSSTTEGPDKAWAHGMNTFNPSVSYYPSSRTHAFNVRCIKD
jgi:uncharacterized protein (TIGR02145 family)